MSAWVSDSVLWLGGAIVAVAAAGGLVWLIAQSNDKGSRRSRPKTKKEIWTGVKEPAEHMLYLYSALGSNPIDCEILTLFCQTYGQRLVILEFFFFFFVCFLFKRIIIASY